MKHEEWKKKPTVQEKDSLASGGSDLEVMKRPRHSQNWSQDEVDEVDDGKTNEVASTAMMWRKICSSFSSEARGCPFKQRQKDDIDQWQIFPLHHPVLPENWRASSKAREIKHNPRSVRMHWNEIVGGNNNHSKKGKKRKKRKMGIVGSHDKKKEILPGKTRWGNQSRINLMGVF